MARTISSLALERTRIVVRGGCAPTATHARRIVSTHRSQNLLARCCGVATLTGYDSLDDLRSVDSKALPALSARLHGCRVSTSAAGCGGHQQSHHKRAEFRHLARQRSLRNLMMACETVQLQVVWNQVGSACQFATAHLQNVMKPKREKEKPNEGTWLEQNTSGSEFCGARTWFCQRHLIRRCG